jgi:serine/threonine-protein kinase RsbW
MSDSPRMPPEPDSKTPENHSLPPLPGHSITLTAQFDNLDRVREFVGDAARQCCMEPADVYSVQLAVDEAFTNIVEHAYGGECLEKIECACQISLDGLTITLRDCGKPFNPLEVPDPNLDAALEAREVGGLGLYFIRQLMDEVRFTFMYEPEIGKNCNLLTLVKHKE